jgi:hypothetical protein
VWRDDRVLAADHALRWLRSVAPADPQLSYDQVLADLGGADPGGRFLRLLDAGLLQPVPPWQRGEDPLAVLGDVVAEEGGVSRRDVRTVHTLASGLAHADADVRVTTAATVRQVTRSWADPSDPGDQDAGGLLYEDRETDLDLLDPRALPTFGSDLSLLADRLRPRIFRSHLYDVLVDRFVAEFGAGGGCVDPLGFLMRLSVDRDTNPPVQHAQAADLRARAHPGERTGLPVGPTSAPPSAGVFLQVAADSEVDALAGRHRLVVNQFGAGSGSLLARFSSLLGDEFADSLRQHVSRCWEGVPCRELVVWTDCNTAQAECAGILPPLLLPGEPAAPHAATLEETALVHDAMTDTLSLCDRRGEPFGLAYLGLTPQHLLQGYTRLLAVLADPWVNGSPDCDYTITNLLELTEHCTDEVVALPRRSLGRLVTRRASWITPVGALPAPTGDDADLVLRLAAFRREHGLPEEVFVQQLGGVDVPTSGVRKPMWVSLASPVSVGVLFQGLRPGTRHLRIVEALPGRQEHPQHDRAGLRRATEHVALLHWPRPVGRST